MRTSFRHFSFLFIYHHAHIIINYFYVGNKSLEILFETLGKFENFETILRSFFRLEE